MKKDPNEHAMQLSLNFDSPSALCRHAVPELRAAGLTLVYSAPAAPTLPAHKESSEREVILSETLLFARKLSW